MQKNAYGVAMENIKKMFDYHYKDYSNCLEHKNTEGMNFHSGAMHASKGYVDEQYDKITCSTFDISCSLHYYKSDDGSHVLADGGLSAYRSNFKYKVGEIVESGAFDDDRWTECSDGIHFFMSPEEAENYAIHWLYQV